MPSYLPPDEQAICQSPLPESYHLAGETCELPGKPRSNGHGKSAITIGPGYFGIYVETIYLKAYRVCVQPSYNNLMPAPQPTVLYIRQIGPLASDVLASENSATIFGVISRGIFLQFKHNRMIFLSFENYPGPLTATLSGGKQFFSNLPHKGTVSISHQGLQFPRTGIRISTSKARAWVPVLPPEHPMDPRERLDLMRQFTLEVYQRESEVGICRFLPALVGFDPAGVNLDDDYQGIERVINKTRDQLARRDLIPLIQILISLLGLGSGLTPGGDDFILGLLLSLNRWESVLRPGKDLPMLNKKVVESAYRDTTTLSANLIECAALGLADERLIRANDYLATGKSQQSEIISGLRSWGNSSGMDALVGMVTAFLALS